MNRQLLSLSACLVAIALAFPRRAETTCIGPAFSYLIEVKVLECSSPAASIRDRVEYIDALMRAVDSGGRDPEHSVAQFMDPKASEAEVQKRLSSGDEIATLSIHRRLRFKESRTRELDGAWGLEEDSTPVKYLLTLRGERCESLREEKFVTLFAPFECCDNYPGPNSCLLSLPHAVNVPEDLRHHVRSGV